MKRFTPALAALLLTTGLAAPVHAQYEDVDLLSLSIGYYNAFDNDEAVDFRLEYRPASSVFINHLKPWVGLEFTNEATAWAGGGLLYDWEFTPNWYLTPSVGVGFYAQGSSDLDLGHTIEFRSQLEIAYEFEDQSRIGLSFGHMSNAGFGNDNPGAEIVSLYWHIPF